MKETTLTLPSWSRFFCQNLLGKGEGQRFFLGLLFPNKQLKIDIPKKQLQHGKTLLPFGSSKMGKLSSAPRFLLSMERGGGVHPRPASCNEVSLILGFNTRRTHSPLACLSAIFSNKNSDILTCVNYSLALLFNLFSSWLGRGLLFNGHPQRPQQPHEPLPSICDLEQY